MLSNLAKLKAIIDNTWTKVWTTIKDHTFSVSVKNQVEFPEINIPEVNIPEYPEPIDTRAELERIVKTLEKQTQELKVSPDTSATKKQLLEKLGNIGDILSREKKDLTPDLIAEIQALRGDLGNIGTQIPKTDLKPLESQFEAVMGLLNIDKYTRYDDFKVYINERQFEKLLKSFNVSVSAAGGGGPVRNTAGEVNFANPLHTAIQASDSPSIDAFGRWRISGVETIFDSKQIHDNQPLFWDDQEVSGGGTSSSHSTDTASTTMSVSATTAGKRVRQTFMRFNYQPGKSQLVLLTGVLGDQGTDIAARMGLFDDDNGIFLVNTAGIAGIAVRSSATGSVVDNLVTQANWNIDTFDGTGPSGVTLDFDKAQIFLIDFEWLGVGRVRTGFVVDGKIYYAHAFNHANSVTSVYMSTPNLPIRYEIEAGGTNPATGSLVHICSSVQSEGGTQNNGILMHSDGGTLTGLTTGTSYACLGIRLKSTHLDTTILLQGLSVLLTTLNDFADWELLWNPTVAGTFTYNDLTNSAVQIAQGANTNTVTGGTKIDGDYFSTASPSLTSIRNALRLGSAIDGTPDEIVLTVRPITNNIGANSSLTWRELS